MPVLGILERPSACTPAICPDPIIPISLGVFNLGENSLGDEINNPNKYGVIDPNTYLTETIKLGGFRLGEKQLNQKNKKSLQ